MKHQRVFIIHGWDGYPQEGWFPWLKRELEKHGFETHVPAMPNPDKPKIREWVSELHNVIGEADEMTYLVGHSIGAQAVLRYISELLPDSAVGGISQLNSERDGDSQTLARNPN
ncbi:hypothetical protein EPN83_01350 [Patescibacteria group bacterium]|nr:MAG: hypothetical protein EPN83_01350 [Patescibacteria group bacterium]